MHCFAQTNIQLLNQLRDEGYAVSDLRLVVTSYELAVWLTTGRFRASGKTFISHLVGTASILGSLHMPSELLAAGLLHASYQAGDFGDGLPGVSDAKRERLRNAVGERVEDYVSRYASLIWTDESVGALSANLDNIAQVDRDVVLIRLANELEEHLDLGLLYCSEERRLHTSGEDRCRLMVQIAERLGFQALAEALSRAFQEAQHTTIPLEIRRRHTRDSSFLLAPQSYQRIKDAVEKRLAMQRQPTRR